LYKNKNLIAFLSKKIIIFVLQILNFIVMASRKALKKDINYLYADLLTECFKLSAICSEDKQEKIEVLFSKIIYSCNDFIIRAGKPDGKNNRQLVKAYYRKLGQDLLNDVLEISKDLEDIAQ
jgi:methyltransferase-like protein